MKVTTSKPIPVVRIKIAAEQGARRNSDTRDLIGYREGLEARQLWNRGREAWKMRAEKVLGCELLLISHGGIIRMVGTVEGIRKHEGGRLGIEGTPIPDHPLIGQPDPLHNTSQNPVAYGTISLS
jgi:hypothetical protein